MTRSRAEWYFFHVNKLLHTNIGLVLVCFMLVQFQHSPFILTLILITMPRDIEQDLAINCAAPMLGLGTIVHLVELYFSKT